MNAILRLLVFGVSLQALAPSLAAAPDSGSKPTPGRTIMSIFDGWKFFRDDASPSAPIDKWQDIRVPHTFNAADGLGGIKAHPENKDGYYRGPAWYARTLDVPALWKGKRVFILFEAVSSVAQVYLNGNLLGEHRGGFTAFSFELTAGLHPGPNELRVRVDNAPRDDVLPLAGDFNIDGGIYRPVHLIITDPVCITPLDSATPGSYLTTKALTDSEAVIEAKTMLSNGLADPATAQVSVRILDALNHVVAAQRDPITLASGETKPLVQTIHVNHPHLWNGCPNPYLYHASIALTWEHGNDEISLQPLGLRTVAITNEQGFLLNGQPYPIHGVNAHQDFGDQGWAMSDSDHDTDMDLMRDMGVNAVRLAHYPQSDYVHDLCDKNGILLWNEIPLVNALRDSPAFVANATQQMREMILQRYNHPSAAFWGMFNELDVHDDHFSAKVLGELKREQQELDPSRLNVAASCNFNCVFDTIPDWICYNPYSGWYTGQPGDLTRYIDDRYAENGSKRIGLSEYGAGANPAQHQEGELSRPKPFGQFHPEEWQAYVHEQDWAQIKNNPKLWGSFLWCMFDFPSAHRDEGGHPGLNDKGLVTADRQIKKDAYFFYQANWSDTPMLHINGSRLVDRHDANTEVEVYSNCASVELKLNGKSLGVVTPNILHICRWKDVQLIPGPNTIEATSPGTSLSDQCNWTYTRRSLMPW